jgi:nucleoid-associated protein YgaU
MEGDAVEHDGKLYIKGLTQTQEEATMVWDAIKAVPDWSTEVIADIQAADGVIEAGARTYTVALGDTLTSIATQQLGDAAAGEEIFELNRDQLQRSNHLTPGEVLKLPANEE